MMSNDQKYYVLIILNLLNKYKIYKCGEVHKACKNLIIFNNKIIKNMQ